jgi:putative transposase
MPRTARICPGGIVYHVINRGNSKRTLFEHDGDYYAFERVVLEAHQKMSMRMLAYCIMPNHWHFVLWPEYDGEISNFIGWISMTHTQRWHVVHETVGSGHLYQGRFKNFPVKTDNHFLAICRYVERNALRANIVSKAEYWRWSSLWCRTEKKGLLWPLLENWPVTRPDNWLSIVNQPQTAEEIEAIRTCSRKGKPFGDNSWVTSTANKLGLEYTLREKGRPQKKGLHEIEDENLSLFKNL